MSASTPGASSPPKATPPMANLFFLPALLLSVAAGMLPSASTQPSGPTADATATATTSATATTRTATSDDPFRRYTWGVYQGPMEQTWNPYVQATGYQKRLLGYIAHQPIAHWFGSWNPDDKVADQVRGYIANAQHGDPDALVQLSIFRMEPWEHEICSRLPTKAERASYKRWVDRFANAVGNTPMAIVLQPDGPFALCAPHGSTVPSQLVAYAARVLSAQPRTNVYIEAGAADWPMFGSNGGVDAAVKILVRGGIQYAHGFALDTTHEDSVTDEIHRATAIAKSLASLGYPGRTAVINTSSNGHPYRYGQYTGSDPVNPVVCPSTTTAKSVTCETLGIPPTAAVGSAKWGLSDTVITLARRHVDAYLWFGRPWLYHVGSQPFSKDRALQLVKSTPWR
jgi:endoglucanase